MKNIILIILLLANGNKATASSTLQFISNIKNESLSEEAILLLHCLADESGSNWELSNTDGPHSLYLTESSFNSAKGNYKVDGNTFPILLQNGNAEEICHEIYPKKVQEPPTLDTQEIKEITIQKNKPWLWVSLGAAAVASFLFWKSQQPDHRSIVMN